MDTDSKVEQPVQTIGISKEEILFLLNTLNETTFKGAEIPLVYSIWSKLITLYQGI